MKKWLNSENLILLTIFLLPTYLIKLSFFDIPTNVLEILILLNLLLFVFEKKEKLEEKLKNYKKYWIFIFLIILGILISILVNQNYIIGLGILKGWFILPILLAFLAQSIFRGKEKIKIFQAYFCSSLVVSLISLTYFFLGETTFDGRLEAFFNSPNYLAMYLVPGFIFGFFYFNSSPPAKGGLRRIFNILSLIIFAATIYLTKSYAGWLSLIASLSISVLLAYKNKLKFVVIFLIIIFILIMSLQTRTSKFGDLINFNERSSLASRFMIWQSAGKMLKESWLWGIGPGNFQEKYLENQKYFSPYLEWAVPHPHNLYLNFWLSGGILSLFGFFGLVFVWLKNFWKKENKKELIFLFSILVYILIHGFFDTTYFKNDLSVVFWLVVLF